MSQSPVEWYGYETSPSGSSDQNGNYAASISQSMQQLHQYIQHMQQQLAQQQPMQHPQIQLQLMQQQLMQHPQMQHHCVDQMMQPTSSVSQTSLQNYQHQTPLLTGLYPANFSVAAQLKRLMNAFMIWAKLERGLMAKEHPKKHNPEVSKLLGQKWKAMPIDRKRLFLDEAKRVAAVRYISDLLRPTV